jgi:putative glutamine amidotransferase
VAKLACLRAGGAGGMRPVVGIIACNRTTGGEPSVTVMRRYVEAAIRYGDFAALVVPSLPDAMRAGEVAGRLDGLLLTGSPSNVEPRRYGDAGESAGPFDPERDAMTADLIADFRAAGRPIFGICRGFQELNVAFGGTLRRDLGARHHSPEECDLPTMFAHRHAVALAPKGRLAAAYGRDALTVNSVHFQGVDRLGDGLFVEASAPDGVVEAFSATDVLAVQWHPEWATDADPDAQALFAAFGAMLRNR